MIKEQFGKKVKKIRISKKLSQNELAERSGINRTQISRIEKGSVNVTLETIEKLSLALNIRTRDLMDFDIGINPKPFVKWAGGKNQIMDKLKSFLPKSFDTYYEPFVGGGALLFSMMPDKAVISDNNSELMAAYRCFTDDFLFEELIFLLMKHEKNHNEEYFYLIRNEDREEGFKNEPIYVRAARMIYLNKACFNGLYRVNSNGFFNVPSAKKEKVKTFDRDNFKALRNYFNDNEIIILNEDFEEAVKTAKKGDFVYFDPPYDVYPNKQGFVDYGKDGFGKEEQIRLRDCFVKLSNRGVYVMLSNHNTPFINELYDGFNINVIHARRVINSKAEGRGYVQEVIITNY